MSINSQSSAVALRGRRRSSSLNNESFNIERLEERRMLSVGPDGFGYVASAKPLEAIDLKPGGKGVFVIVDDSSFAEVPLDLGTNTFSFYGHNYTGTNRQFVSNAGFTFFPTDPIFAPNGPGSPFFLAPPVLAPLELAFSGSEEPGYQILGKFDDTTGDGRADRLIIEWNKTFAFEGGNSVTFQAILQLNTGSKPGDITFNYPDIDTGNPSFSNGQNALVGIKDLGTQGPNQLILNSGTGSPLVGTGKAILFHNAATGQPKARAGGPYTATEGKTLKVTGVTSSDPNQTASTLKYAWDFDGDGLYGESGAEAPAGDETGVSPTFDATPFDGPADVPIALRVTDSTGFNSFANAIVHVNNAPPKPTLEVPTAVLPGQRNNFSVGATDPSPFDQSFFINIDFGDGTSVSTFTDFGSNAIIPHAYQESGSFTVKVTATDANGAISPALSRTIKVARAGVAADPADATKTALFVGGTNLGDTINIATATGGKVSATLNGSALGTFAAGRIIVVGGRGADKITVAKEVTLATELFGGTNNDTLQGGSGPDFISGGDGNDFLVGNGGRDWLIGGAGSDNIQGGAGDEILMAGIAFEFDNVNVDPTYRRLVMNEWTRTDQDYQRRIDHLRFGGGFNKFTVIGGASLSDSDTDTLTGGSDNDWFFAQRTAVPKDKITDLLLSEDDTETF